MTANQQYKEYKKEGGTLSFSEWIDREKKKGFMNLDGKTNVPENKSLTDSIQKTLSQIHKEAGLKTGLENKYILGIHKNVWIVTGVVAAGITAFVIYKKMKKRG